MNITKIIRQAFNSRLKEIDLYASQAGEIQHRVMTRLPIPNGERSMIINRYEITRSLKAVSLYKPMMR